MGDAIGDGPAGAKGDAAPTDCRPGCCGPSCEGTEARAGAKEPGGSGTRWNWAGNGACGGAAMAWCRGCCGCGAAASHGRWAASPPASPPEGPGVQLAACGRGAALCMDS
eukprot:CAMPEP_0175266942 /NCGR_PEP_ID=MMETSP0093-20121207/43592_1 /TAXON_ID=311494 /ORGANISM="Alexandrium monilatum, Strain CCMP3105" /LENGTH=109 /DNA_ID=CAMNT_0016561561 /DNA_START=76 /DNA_END=405 /DNA_ORIENTATION=-